MDKQLVEARVAGRTAANELTDKWIAASKDLRDLFGDTYGIEAAIAFLDTLRDNLIAVRPLAAPTLDSQQTVEIRGESQPIKQREREPETTWDHDDVPDGYELAELNREAVAESGNAWGFTIPGSDKLLWLPKSRMYEPGLLSQGDYVTTWPIERWLCDREGLDY